MRKLSRRDSRAAWAPGWCGAVPVAAREGAPGPALDMRAGVLQLSRCFLFPEPVAAHSLARRRVAFAYSDGEAAVTLRPTPWVDALYAPRRHLLDRDSPPPRRREPTCCSRRR